MASNPAIQRGLSNLARMFAPPDAGELVAYGRLNDMQRRRQGEEAFGATLTPERRAILQAAGPETYLQRFPQYDLYNRSTQPGATPQSLDASAFALNGNANNTFAGLTQRIAGEDRRNSQDNARAIAVAGLSPISEGATRVVDQNTVNAARGAGVQTAPGVVRGGIRLGSNQTFFDGAGTPIASGPERPENESQARVAGARQALQEGRITQDEYDDAIWRGSAQTTTVQGPNGPIAVPTGRAVREGLPLAAAPAARGMQNLVGARTRRPINFDPATGQRTYADDGTVANEAAVSATVQATDTDGISGSQEGAVVRPLLTQQDSANRFINTSRRLQEALRSPTSAAAGGWVGSAITFANELRSQVQAATGFIENEQNQREVATGLQNGLANLNSTGLFQRLQQQGIDVAQIRSLIQELAYARAIANNAGGTLSNRDVQAAVEEIGGAASDPIVLSNVLDSVAERVVEQFNTTLQSRRQAYPEVSRLNNFQPLTYQRQGMPATGNIPTGQPQQQPAAGGPRILSREPIR
jgi:hypothetical protein